MNIETN